MSGSSLSRSRPIFGNRKIVKGCNTTVEAITIRNSVNQIVFTPMSNNIRNRWLQVLIRLLIKVADTDFHYHWYKTASFFFPILNFFLPILYYTHNAILGPLIARYNYSAGRRIGIDEKRTSRKQKVKFESLISDQVRNKVEKTRGKPISLYIELMIPVKPFGYYQIYYLNSISWENLCTSLYNVYSKQI